MIKAKAIVIIVIGILLFLWGVYNNEKSIVILKPSFSIKKKVNLKYFILFLLFWLFAVCVTESYDISNYRYAYDGRISHGKEPFFDIIQFYFYDHGRSFDFFKFIWVTVVAIGIYVCIKRYAKYPAAVMALALVTPLTEFITQMRSALAGIVVLNAIPFIFRGRIRNKIAYAIIVVLCAQIHILVYAYLIFLLINPKESKITSRVYYAIISVLIIVALFFSSVYMKTIFYALNNLPIVGNSVRRIISYFQGQGNHFRYAFFLMIKHLFLFFLCNKACEIQERKHFLGSEGGLKFRMIREANALMLVFLPIMMMSGSFERLFNYFSLIQYAMIFNICKPRKLQLGKISWHQSMRVLLIIGMVGFCIIENYFDSSDTVTIFNSIEWPF